MQKFFLTTPIYYVNARPHIGHAYTTIVADVLARRARAQGIETFFLTGTDEHGQKIERSAAAAGIPPQQFADQVSAAFSTLWQRMGITHDDFIRTTSARHKRGVQKLFQTLKDNGKIELRSYTGSYCVSDEAFVDLPAGTPCPDCGRPLETVTEQNYFFKLSEYQLPLINLIESGELSIQPESRRNEVLSFLRGPVSTFEKEAVEQTLVILSEAKDPCISPSSKLPQIAFSALGTPYVPGALKDLSISRTSFKWGIPVPGEAGEEETGHVIYVWLDALANYMTALGYGSEDDTLFRKFWPADLHIVGKEIIRFHCVYWPAFLLAANLPLPKQVVAHGWLLFEKSKMSKSRGNIVRTETILDAFGTLCPPPVAAPPPSFGLSFRSAAEESAFALPSANTPTNPVILSAEKDRAFALPSTNTSTNPVILSAAKDPCIGTSPAPPQHSPEATINGTTSVVPFTTPALPPSNTPTNPAILTLSDAKGKDPCIGTSPTPEQPLTEATIKGTTSVVPFTTPTQTPASAAEELPLTAHHRDLFAADVLRYFLLREIPFGQDGTFSFEALITRYNADLANGYGNLVSRTLNMMEKFREGQIPEPNQTFLLVDQRPTVDKSGVQTIIYIPTESVLMTARATVTGTFNEIEKTEFYEYLKMLWNFVRVVDGYISLNEPWKLASNPAKQRELNEVLYTAAESIRIITALLYPILPYATASVWRLLGLGDIERAAANGELKTLQWGGLKPGTHLGPLSPIFPRADTSPDKGLAQIMTDMESPKPTPEIDCITTPNDPPAAILTAEDPSRAPFIAPLSHAMSGSTSTAPDTEPDAAPQITIDDFAKVELRVAQILLCERIPKADKLLRLEVDLGYEKRQILSGIAEWYTPEELIGRRIVVITNLAPRKMRGLESHGMLLAASAPAAEGEAGGKPHLATFVDSETLPLGARLK
jgi:methionine--tRNA ligase beta chain